MKSFIAYPLDFQKELFPQAANKSFSGKLIAHYELFKKVKHLDGCIVKCGITPDEGFSRFIMLKSLVGIREAQKMIAFEKPFNNHFQNAIGENYSKTTSIEVANFSEIVEGSSVNQFVEFAAGNINDAIPNYLIENPEVKIAFLNIDLDDYESTISTLEFFYPRLVEGGILVMDNYFKNQEEARAINDYFSCLKPAIHNFSVNRGPHYIVKL